MMTDYATISFSRILHIQLTHESENGHTVGFNTVISYKEGTEKRAYGWETFTVLRLQGFKNETGICKDKLETSRICRITTQGLRIKRYIYRYK
jgi:hypothetical protein